MQLDSKTTTDLPILHEVDHKFFKGNNYRMMYLKMQNRQEHAKWTLTSNNASGETGTQNKISMSN